MAHGQMRMGNGSGYARRVTELAGAPVHFLLVDEPESGSRCSGLDPGVDYEQSEFAHAGGIACTPPACVFVVLVSIQDVAGRSPR